MIIVENLSFGFPKKELFNQINFSMETGTHAALIGASGTGKSTLAELLHSRDHQIFDGKIHSEGGLRIAYMQQVSPFQALKGLTVSEFIGTSFFEQRRALDALCDQMATASEEALEAILETYQEQLDHYSALGGDTIESEIQKQLNIAGMNDKGDLPVVVLSGGEFKLVQVIRAMLEQPELLIMDEPDAFLDFQNLTALMQLINDYKGSLLVITHNRFLLNHCFNQILHLENKVIQQFDGTYPDYQLALLKAKVELQEEAHKHAEAVAKNEALIERLRFHATYNSEASRGKALRARVKHHERLEAQAIQAPFVEIQEPPIRFHTAKPLPVSEVEGETDDFAFKIENYSMGFDEALLEDVSFQIGPRDKVALLGPNGSGKTTLLRDLVKNENQAIQLHPDVRLGYLSQLQGECLDDKKTPLDALYDAGLHSTRRIISYLGQYGFSEGAIHDPIEKLSGGEKNVLQLAMLSIQDFNLLLLDEPTSHLDTYGQKALENAIANYEGAVFMVSHDFFTIANCMDYVLMIEDQKIRRLSLKKFRRMVFAQYFKQDYAALDAKLKALTLEVNEALSQYDFEKAKKVVARLEALY